LIKITDSPSGTKHICTRQFCLSRVLFQYETIRLPKTVKIPYFGFPLGRIVRTTML